MTSLLGFAYKDEFHRDDELVNLIIKLSRVRERCALKAIEFSRLTRDKQSAYELPSF